MTEMRDKDTISKGPKKRDATCFELRHAVLIPAGTILRQAPGQPGVYTAPAGFGTFSIEGSAAMQHPADYKRVIA